MGPVSTSGTNGQKATSAPESSVIYQFGPYRLDKLRRMLFMDGRRIALTPKVFDTLVYLVENRQRPVAKEELMCALWADAKVEERNLTQNISVLRKALNETPREHRYIVTLPNRGYLFAADVSEQAVVARPERPTRRKVKLLLPAVLALAVCVVAGRHLWRAVFPPRSGASFTVTSFTSLPGREFLPAFSPDASRIAFAWNGENESNFDIYAKPCGGGGLVRLTRHPAADLHPAWSPDGKTVAFVRTWSRVPVFRLLAFTQPPSPPGAAGDDGLYLVPANGQRTETRVRPVFGARALFAGRMIDWLPSGDRIVISDKGSPDAPFRLYAIDLKNGSRTELTSPEPGIVGDDAPAVSPDGARVAFLRCAAVSAMDVYVTDLLSGATRRITSDAKEIRGLTWTRDGSEIVFSSNRGGVPLLWRIAALDKNAVAQPVSGVGADSFYPVAGRGAPRLAYARMESNRNIWRTSMEEDASSRKFVYSTRFESYPRYSPDGRRIVFSSNRSGYYEIWICDAEGGNAAQVTSYNGPSASNPRWLPDGKGLVFELREDSKRRICRISTGGGPIRNLTGGDTDDVTPAPSADGKSVYFASNRSGDWQVWNISLADGSPRRITRNGGYAPFESADGRFLYYTNSPGEGSIFRRTLPDGPTEAIASNALPGWWTAANGGIYIARPASTHKAGVVSYWNPRTRRERTVRTVAGLQVIGPPAFAVSPDGKWLLYPREDQGSSDIMLVDNFDNPRKTRLLTFFDKL